ncbi:MAG TPA: hypothetical protein VND45_03185 [Thermoanaerobaculia bacterium]|nr:hypothetical protein [Thermoanaerobaculia bacterium]
MTRRIASLAGIIVLLALAVTLLWRVYLHHRQADPYEREAPVTVELDAPATVVVKFANDLS